jgi:hypothetical protein
MLTAAITVSSSVGAAAGPVGCVGLEIRTIPTNATIARKTPMSRINRFERFK